MVTVSFHGVYWIKCIQLFPSYLQLKTVFIDIIHKSKTKKTPAFEGGAVMWVECKVTGQSTSNYLHPSSISYQDPSLSAEMPVLSPVCFAKYCIFILHASYPLQRLWTECCKSSRQQTSENCTTYMKSRQCHCTCDLLETKLPRVLVFPFNN